MGPESRLEAYLGCQVKKLGGLYFKFVSPGHAGVPDRIIVFKSKVIFVELKSAAGKLSPLQIKTIQQLRNCGAMVFVIKSKSEVDDLMRSLICQDVHF